MKMENYLMELYQHDFLLRTSENTGISREDLALILLNARKFNRGPLLVNLR